MVGGHTQRSSVTNNFVQASKTIAAVVHHALSNGHSQVEATSDAVEGWSEILLPITSVGEEDLCTPSYLNNEGKQFSFKVGFEHPEGSDGFFRYMEQWRRSGTFDGLVFS
jgi:cyclohexanone monooxygenase